MIKYSIIVPTLESNSYLDKLFLSLKKFENRSDIELIIVSNVKCKTDIKFNNILYKNIVNIDIKHPGKKRDIGSLSSVGEFLIFIDDDAYFSSDYFKVLDNLTKEGEYNVICGPNITPKDDSYFAYLSGSTYDNPLLGVSYRYNNSKILIKKSLDDFPSVNLVIKKTTFNGVNGFNNDYWPGDDTYLCNKLKENGDDIVFFSNLIVYHYRRSFFIKHVRQVFRYGLTRGFFYRLNFKNSRKISFTLPSLYLILNIILFVNLNIFFLFITINYLTFLLFSFKNYKKISISILSPFLIILNFYIYGFSFIKGIFTKKLNSKLGR